MGINVSFRLLFFFLSVYTRKTQVHSSPRHYKKKNIYREGAEERVIEMREWAKSESRELLSCWVGGGHSSCLSVWSIGQLACQSRSIRSVIKEQAWTRTDKKAEKI